MRWDPLFDDLASQADATDEADADALAAEQTRHIWGQCTVVERLRAAAGTRVRCRGMGGLDVSGTVHQVGPDWVLVSSGPTRWLLVAVAALTVMEGLPAAADMGAPSRLDTAHTMRAVVRQLCCARRPVEIATIDGLRLVGTVARVGADHLDLACHPLDEGPRLATVRGVAVITLTGLVSVTWLD